MSIPNKVKQGAKRPITLVNKAQRPKKVAQSDPMAFLRGELKCVSDGEYKGSATIFLMDNKNALFCALTKREICTGVGSYKKLKDKITALVNHTSASCSTDGSKKLLKNLLEAHLTQVRNSNPTASEHISNKNEYMTFLNQQITKLDKKDDKKDDDKSGKTNILGYGSLRIGGVPGVHGTVQPMYTSVGEIPTWLGIGGAGTLIINGAMLSLGFDVFFRQAKNIMGGLTFTAEPIGLVKLQGGYSIEAFDWFRINVLGSIPFLNATIAQTDLSTGRRLTGNTGVNLEVQFQFILNEFFSLSLNIGGSLMIPFLTAGGSPGGNSGITGPNPEIYSSTLFIHLGINAGKHR